MSEPLPDGWTWATPDDVAARVPNALTIGPFGSDLKVSDYRDAGVPLVFVRDIRAGRFGGERTKFVDEEKAKALSRHYVRPGDLLVTKMGDPPGDTAVYPSERPPGIITADCIKLTPNTGIVIAAFLRDCFRAEPVKSQVLEQTAGVAQQKLSLERFRTVRLPLPPLTEQRRIASKLENLLARSRRARGALDTVPPLLEKLRQSILAAAFRGDLTADWRAKHPEVEPAEKLLARIRIERRRKWEEGELAKMKGKGRAPGDDRWKEKYREPEGVDGAGLPGLPVGWCWANVDELCAASPNALTIGPFGSDLKVNDYRNEGVPLVFVRDIRAEVFGGAKTKFVSPEKAEALSKHLVQPGDLLITKMGDPPGDTAVYPANRPAAVVTADCIKLAPFAAVTDGTFLKYCFRAQVVRDQLLEQTAGVAQQKLSLERFRTVVVPLPPREEQRALVARLDALSGRAAETFEMMRRLRQSFDELNSACLAKAFRGELVPQDPNDEPAEVMLARMRSAPTESVRLRRRGA